MPHHQHILIFILYLTTTTYAREGCPTICECSEYTVTCIDGQETNLDMLQMITRSFYPNLAQLTVTGNNWGDISGKDLMPRDGATDTVSMLDISDNQITMLDAVTLRQFTDVQTLNISENNIEHIPKVNIGILDRLPRIREFYAVNAFSDKMGATEMADTLRSIFYESSNVFNQLRHVVLDNNHIERIHPETFCKLTGLITLSLRGNQLTTYSIHPQCSPGPNVLYLSDNKLSYIHDGDMENWNNNFEHLAHLDVSMNPWKCDCYSRSFIKYYKMNIDAMLNTSTTICATGAPRVYDGAKMEDVNIDELMCTDNGDGSSSGGVYSFMIFAMIALAAVLVCVAYVNRRALLRPFLTPQPYRQQGGYNVVGGYHKLNTGEESNVEAEFV